MQKIAIITGASRGIGAATAQRLAAEKYDVCVNYNSQQEAAEAVADKVRAYGCKAIVVQADIANEQQVAQLFETVDRDLGRPTVLVNNAGILFPQARLTEMDAQRINRLLAVNVTGYFLCCQQAVLRMSTRHGGKGGVIVNVSSAAARLGSPGEYIDYAASKGAVDTLTIGLAAEVAQEGIRVNAVRPGLIYTDIHASAGEPGRVDRLKQSLPLGRGGRPDEVASAIAFLVSSESSYTTGAFIEVSGGR
ncbi:MAG: NAD(P)-dependent oxidoreductase [SAR86 cluster bacterium]|uniref:3-oxoacyl-[acyl-carrier-protein] reductase FabG n=1 Tax=SAR86 cluster bacterium TaxID=2030880 RepID=A0A2A4MQA1_9GAMM|nr:MAG: NAD(P)-dependent oxidoreductase [SAR86 cluster bacterium]